MSKTAGASVWRTRRRGVRSSVLALAYDATADEYYIATDEDADAWLVYDSKTGEYFVSDTNDGQGARLMKVGASDARVME